MDEFVLMPDHIHGIVVIVPPGNVDVPQPDGYDVTFVVGATGRSPSPPPVNRLPSRSLGAFMAGFKSAATRRINAIRGTPGRPVWQRNYYEHIIRTEREWRAIREYIRRNPERWRPRGSIPRS